tara:strand:- start:226 stop:429 length:204 start_codon:yes stop_codon:yes gene_type:complete
MEFFLKNEPLAMTSKLHLAPFSLAKNFLQLYQWIWRNLSARILLESGFFYMYIIHQSFYIGKEDLFD